MGIRTLGLDKRMIPQSAFGAPMYILIVQNQRKLIISLQIQQYVQCRQLHQKDTCLTDKRRGGGGHNIYRSANTECGDVYLALHVNYVHSSNACKMHITNANQLHVSIINANRYIGVASLLELYACKVHMYTELRIDIIALSVYAPINFLKNNDLSSSE
jgi:hypothetical protein